MRQAWWTNAVEHWLEQGPSGPLPDDGSVSAEEIARLEACASLESDAFGGATVAEESRTHVIGLPRVEVMLEQNEDRCDDGLDNVVHTRASLVFGRFFPDFQEQARWYNYRRLPSFQMLLGRRLCPVIEEGGGGGGGGGETFASRYPGAFDSLIKCLGNFVLREPSQCAAFKRMMIEERFVNLGLYGMASSSDPSHFKRILTWWCHYTYGSEEAKEVASVGAARDVNERREASDPIFNLQSRWTTSAASANARGKRERDGGLGPDDQPASARSKMSEEEARAFEQAAERDLEESKREPPNPTFFVYCAILYKVSAAYDLGALSDLSLAAFADLHLPLCAFMLRRQAFDDLRLQSPRLNPESACGADSALTAHYPFVYREVRRNQFLPDGPFLMAHLPNVSDCMECAELHFSNRSQYDSIFRALVHLLVTKSQPHKCANRNIGDMLLKMSQRYPAILRLFRMGIGISAMGMYPHCKVRPPFGTRVLLYQQLRGNGSVAQFNNKALATWIKRNSLCAYFITREMCFGMFPVNIPLQKVMGLIPQWNESREQIIAACDFWRSYVLTSLVGQDFKRANELCMVPDDDGVHDPDGTRAVLNSPRFMIHDMLDRHHVALVRHATKLVKGTFENVSLTCMDKLRHERAPDVATLDEIRRSGIDSLVRRVAEAHVAHCKILRLEWIIYSHDVRSGARPRDPLIEDSACLLNGATEDLAMWANCPPVPSPSRYLVQLKWLKMLGISSRETFEGLKECLAQYESQEITDNRLKDFYETIRMRSEKDFLLIYLFCSRVSQYRSMADSFPLSVGAARNQLRALRMKLKLQPWDHLPESFHCLLYCQVCHSWSVPKVRLTEPRSWVDTFAIGMSYVAWDPTENCLKCDKQRNDDDDDDEEDEDKDGEEEDDLPDRIDHRGIVRMMKGVHAMLPVGDIINTITKSGQFVSNVKVKPSSFGKRKRRHKSNRGVSPGTVASMLSMLFDQRGYVDMHAKAGDAESQVHSSHNMRMITHSMIRNGPRDNTLLLSRDPLSERTGRGQVLNCSDAPMRCVNMLGREQLLSGKRWVMCEICASITPFENHNVDSSGRITCGIHRAARNVPPIDSIDHVIMQLPGLSIRCEFCDVAHPLSAKKRAVSILTRGDARLFSGVRPATTIKMDPDAARVSASAAQRVDVDLDAPPPLESMFAEADSEAAALAESARVFAEIAAAADAAAREAAMAASAAGAAPEAVDDDDDVIIVDERDIDNNSKNRFASKFTPVYVTDDRPVVPGSEAASSGRYGGYRRRVIWICAEDYRFVQDCLAQYPVPMYTHLEAVSKRRKGRALNTAFSRNPDSHSRLPAAHIMNIRMGGKK